MFSSRQRIRVLAIAATGVLLGAAVGHQTSFVVAQDCTGLPIIDGANLTTVFAGNPSTLQDRPTGFGDVREAVPVDSEGNELDRLFVANDSTTLFIGITGNTLRSDVLENTVLVFIDTGDNGGTAVLDTAGCCGANGGAGCGDAVCETCVFAIDPTCMTDWNENCASIASLSCTIECPCEAMMPPVVSNALENLHGVTLDFAPEFALAVWNDAGVQNGLLIDLRDPNAQGRSLVESVEFAVDNSNLVGVNAEAANDPTLQEQNAVTATTGLEFAVTLAELDALVAGTDSVNIQVLLVGGSGTISNQSLPPLRATDGINGGGVDCVGNHDPAAIPPNVVDFSEVTIFPDPQNVTYALLSPGIAVPPTLDGQVIDETQYDGPPLSTQNNFTCFGDAAPFSPAGSNGSELNQVFITSDADKLYIGITGNIPSPEDNQNTIMIFLDTEDGLTDNVLRTAGFTGGSPALANSAGLMFDGIEFDSFTGFTPDWAIMYWRGGSRHNAVKQSLIFDADVLPLIFSNRASDHAGAATGNFFFSNLGNRDGVNDISGDDPLRQEIKAATGQQGVLFSITLGGIDGLAVSPFGQIRVAVAIISGEGFVSNQFLPPLNPTDPVPVLANEVTSPALAISDNDVTPNALSISVGVNRITDLKVTVDITHPAVEELNIDLQYEAPGDTRTVRLWQGNVAGAGMNTTFANGGADLATWVAPGIAEFEVNDPVLNSLLTFNNVNPSVGTWTLIIQDTVAGNVGTLNSWTLDLREDIGGAVGCLGLIATTTVDLNGPDTPGDQFLDYTLTMAGTPIAFDAQDIPAAFPAAALSTQNNHTCFGDSNETALANPPGSEMDQMFISNSNDRLQIAVTGNLEANGNAFIILLDNDATSGSLVISNITAPPEPLGGGGDETGLNEMTMDAGFTPDWAVVVQRSDFAAPADEYNVFLTDLHTNLTRAIGRVLRNSRSGQLLLPVPNQNGSELNQMFVQNDVDNLYMGLTGNLEGNGNVFIVLLDTDPLAGTELLATDIIGFHGAVRGLDGTTLDVGFAPDYAIVWDRGGGNSTATLMDLVNTMPVVVTNLTLTSTIGANTFFGDNTNAVGVNSNPADDTADDDMNGKTNQVENAETATTGVQFCIALSSIGGPLPLDEIKVMAVVAGSSGWWSNNSLPGMGGGASNLELVPDLTLTAGDQFAAYTIADGSMGNPFSAPTQFDGRDIPTVMAGGLLATQDNHTGFGNAALPPNAGNANCMQIAFNDSNLVGVTDQSATPEEAQSAETGMEFEIPFADIGQTPVDGGGDGAEVRVLALLTGTRGWLSNQFLPTLGDFFGCNLGAFPNLGPAACVDLSSVVDFPGDQFLSYTIALPCNAFPLSDINGDGAFTPDDVAELVDVLLGINTDPASCSFKKSDVNSDTLRDGADIALFVQDVLTP